MLLARAVRLVGASRSATAGRLPKQTTLGTGGEVCYSGILEIIGSFWVGGPPPSLRRGPWFVCGGGGVVNILCAEEGFFEGGEEERRKMVYPFFSFVLLGGV